MDIGLLNVEGFAGINDAKATVSRVMSLHQLDAAVFTETWLPYSTPFDVIGYRCYVSDSPPVANTNRHQGGVLICIRTPLSITHVGSVCTPTYQAVTVTFYHPALHEELTLSGAYVSPRCTPADTSRLLDHLAAARGGAAVIAGDFNARHTDWDRTKTPRGNAVRSFLIRQHYRAAIPAAPTYRSHHGSSTVDFSVYRGLSSTCCVLKHGSWDARSHHRLVVTRYKRRDAGTLRIPRSVLANPAIRRKVKITYDSSLPRLTAQVYGALSPDEVEATMKKVIQETVQPWLTHFYPKPPRFRPGWNHALERMSKRRRQLLRAAARTKDADLSAQARALDKDIKRTFRRNKRRLLRNSIQEAATHSDTALGPQLSAILARFGLKSDTNEGLQIDPAAFTRYMQQTQRADPKITLEPFYPVRGFKDELRSAILRGKAGKAPGDDGVMNEMMQIHPDGFSALLLELWAAVGRTEYMPMALRDGVVVPLFKKGDPTQPENYRPIVLLSHFRKAISSALNAVVTKAYQFHPNQWGFQSKVGTDFAILHASAKAQYGKDNIAVLDLSRAYDTVPRLRLAELCLHRLGAPVSTMILPLLSPITIRTKGQRSTEEVAELVCGVPQGDVISPTLYNIFMEPLLETVCGTFPDGLSCYCDDTTGLARNPRELQAILNMAHSWAEANGMKWNARKSAALTDGTTVRLGEECLRNAQCVDYLGVSLTRRGTTDGRYQSRVKAAGFVLHQLMHALRGVRLSPTLKYKLFRAHVISRIDYAVPCIPMTPQAEQACDALERRGIAWCLSRPQSSLRDMARAAALVGFMTRAYRQEHLSWKMAGKLVMGAQLTEGYTARERATGHRYHRVLRCFAEHPHSPVWPEWPDQLTTLQERCTEASEKVWIEQLNWANRHRTRPIPKQRQRACVPILRSRAPLWVQLLCIRWYLYRFPTPHTPLNPNGLETMRRALGRRCCTALVIGGLKSALADYAPPSQAQPTGLHTRTALGPHDANPTACTTPTPRASEVQQVPHTTTTPHH